MSFYSDTQTPSHVARLVNLLSDIVVARTRELVQLVKHRHDANRLATLDDRMLADIGLTRGDVRDAYSEPVWRDPTAILVSRARERRSSRRGYAPRPAAGDEAPSIVPAHQDAPVKAPMPSRYY